MARPAIKRNAVGAVLLLGILSASAWAGDMRAAAKMSEALGGSLEDGMVCAAFSGHGKLDTSVALKPGRGDEFRRRVASVFESQSHLATSAH
jgi:hypothetical protein